MFCHILFFETSFFKFVCTLLKLNNLLLFIAAYQLMLHFSKANIIVCLAALNFEPFFFNFKNSFASRLKEKLWKLLIRSVLTLCLTRFQLWLSMATRTLSLGSFLSQTWEIWPITEWWWWRGRGIPVTWMTRTPGTKLSQNSLVRCKGSQRGSVDFLQHNHTPVAQRSLATKTNTKYWSYMEAKCLFA